MYDKVEFIFKVAPLYTHTHHLNKRKKVDVFVFLCIKRPFYMKLVLPVKWTVFPGAKKKAGNPLLKRELSRVNQWLDEIIVLHTTWSAVSLHQPN